MIYEKRGMWKVVGFANKFADKKQAEDFAKQNGVPSSEYKNPEEVEQVAQKMLDDETLSPLEKIRGWKEPCNECGCDPCECEWKSVEETSSETESLTEEAS